MNWEAIGSVSDVMATIAIIASLVYLAVQLGAALPGATEPTRFPDLQFILRHSSILVLDENLSPRILTGEPTSRPLGLSSIHARFRLVDEDWRLADPPVYSAARIAPRGRHPGKRARSRVEVSNPRRAALRPQCDLLQGVSVGVSTASGSRPASVP